MEQFKNTEAKDIEYNRSKCFYAIKTPESGFGFSNFRKNTNLEQVKEYQSPVIRYDNPVSEFDFARNSNFYFKDHYPDYNLTDTKKKNKNYYDTLKTFQELNPLIYAFLSQENIDHLQSLISLYIKKLYNYDIGPSKEIELVAVMRAIYITSKNNYPMAKGDDLIKQVCRLNKDVIDKVIPLIVVNIQSYLSFARDKSTNPYTIDRPISASVSGLKNFNGFDKNII